MTAPMAEVSVVIPSLGDPGLSAAIASVLASGRSADIDTEVIVVWQRPGVPDVPADVVVQAHAVNVSYARNRGVEAATAPLVGYVDEDEVVEPQWVAALAEALEDADAAFGPIVPVDGHGRPHCLTDHGAPRVFGAATPPWLVGSGGSMAFRRATFAGLRGFDLRFGAASIGRSAEETELIWRLLHAGRHVRWAPEMVVHHPTKTDAEILASRYPYGYGAGRLLRRTRSVRLTANYVHAVAHAHWGALHRRDAAALREAAVFGKGLAAGFVRHPTWSSPDLASQEVPPPISDAVGGRRGAPRPVAWGRGLHYSWQYDDATLHAHVGPTDAQVAAVTARGRLVAAAAAARAPAIRAHARSRDALWVLEDRVDGTPLQPTAAATWWPEAVAHVASYAAAPAAAWEPDAGAWSAASPLALRGAVADALEHLRPRPTGVAHVNLRPADLLTTPRGLVARSWETFGSTALRGRDLVALATAHAEGGPDHDVVRGLLEGRNPSFGDVLGPLRDLGLAGPVLADALLLMVVSWASDERRREAAFGLLVPPGRPYGDLLTALTPLLLRRVAVATPA